MKASDAIVEYLYAHGVVDCYEMIGGMIAHIVDSMGQHEGINITSMHHEQSAAFAAEGVSRKGGGVTIGLAMATSGPGATNLLTGIGSCWFDSVPCVFLTGQVNVSELKLERPIRQQGFQELDIVPLVSSITKYASRVMTVEDLLPELHRALSDAVTGRPGPVLLDIPNNIQKEEIADEMVEKWIKKPLNLQVQGIIDKGEVAEVKAMCAKAKRPLFLLGGGAKWSKNFSNLLADLNENGVPYISTLMGQEGIEWKHMYFGMIGSYGHRTANTAIQQCDLVIVLGSRLDVRQTGADTQKFAKNSKIIQVDIDAGQLNNRVQADLSITASVDQFLKQLGFCRSLFADKDPRWSSALHVHLEKTFIDEYPDWQMSPFRILNEIAQALGGKDVDYVTDVGNHQMWVAQCLRLDSNQTIHHSGGMGAMGFALPTAIGISSASKGKTVVLSGDGSLQVNIQELDTVARIGEDMLIVVFNNRSLGMVKNFQDMYFEGRNQSTKIGYSSPSFARLAEAYGIESYLIDDEVGLREVLAQVRNKTSPVFLELVMEQAVECRPRLTFGCALDEQIPPATEVFKMNSDL